MNAGKTANLCAPTLSGAHKHRASSIRVTLMTTVLLACGAEERAAVPTPASRPVPDLDDTSLTEEAIQATANAVCPSARPQFWRVSRAGKISFILGTTHLGVGLDKLPASAIDALAGARLAVFETVSDGQDDADIMLPADEPSLAEQLGAADWRRLELLLGPQLAPRVTRLKPAIVVALLQSLYVDKTAALDEELIAAANARDIPVRGLETDAFQQRLLDRWLDLRFLRCSLAAVDSRRELQADAMAKLSHYCSGADGPPGPSAKERQDMLAGGYSEAEVDLLVEELLFARNRAWLPQLEPMLAGGGAFIAVGVDHLSGPRGIIAMLRARGHILAPVDARPQ